MLEESGREYLTLHNASICWELTYQGKPRGEEMQEINVPNGSKKKNANTTKATPNDSQPSGIIPN